MGHLLYKHQSEKKKKWKKYFIYPKKIKNVQNKHIEAQKTTSCAISLPHPCFPLSKWPRIGENISTEQNRRERDEWGGNVVPGEEGSTEGESEDTLQACPPRYSELGRPSPSLLPRCTTTLHFLSFPAHIF